MNLGFLPDDLVEKVQLPPHLAAMPAPALLDGLPFRVDPAACGDVAESIGVLVTDTQEEVGLIVRHGVMEPVESVPSGATVIIRAPRAVIIAMLLRGLYDTLAQAVETGQAELSHGGLDDARRFFSYFDPVNAAALKLADR